jgi:hypothetical protein
MRRQQARQSLSAQKPDPRCARRAAYLVQRETPLGRWARELLALAHENIVIVALANKLARIAWAVLARGRTYEAASAV